MQTDILDVGKTRKCSNLSGSQLMFDCVVAKISFINNMKNGNILTTPNVLHLRQASKGFQQKQKNCPSFG